jgi:cob(I)alamin adenosyltransferase
MGYVYVYTGTGAGKTTNALGLALRSLGHGHRVVIIQFLKWWQKTGEYKFKKQMGKYGKNYEIYQFGRKGWIGFGNLDERDKALCREALRFAANITKKKRPHLLVLDEINLALYLKLLPARDVIAFLKKLPARTDVVLTGRYAPVQIIRYADFVNVIKDIKHPKKFKTTRGIQY